MFNLNFFWSRKSKAGRPAGSSFFDPSVSLLSGPTFPSYNQFASSSRVDSGQGKTISACASAVASGKGVNFSPIKPLAKIDSVGRVILLVSLRNFSAPFLRQDENNLIRKRQGHAN